MSVSRPWIRRGYAAVLYLLAPLIWRRVWREQLPGRPRSERLGLIPSVGQGERTLWLHCASVGEVQAARPLIEALRQRWPGHRLVITTMTATGAERVLALAGSRQDSGAVAEVNHHFVPLDFPGAARRFVARLRPELAIFFETELWPNLLAACDRSGVPVAVVNGRLSPRAWRGYCRLRPLMAEALSHVAWLAAKSEADARRYADLGMAPARTTVVGSLKFDIGTGGEAREVSDRLRTRLGSRPVWVAGSTHPGEDEQVLAAHARLRERLPDALLVLVPRHPRRFDAVAALCRQEGLTLARRSRDEWPQDDTAVYLGDSMGELLTFYGAVDLAFVGGSLVPIGGHNLLEPAALGTPVLSGPALANFEDVAEVMRGAGALVEVDDAETLTAELLRLFDDREERHRLAEAGRAVVAANRGALARTLAGLEGLMQAE
ncbi:lipid IV(A) 3-deoxy-D-manno-octulosonic acid transferase [Halomonas rhizosphaerae]|uniref:3-deoxy-D-manno-octulosonic acid transferase n=1 Tax=Halomonas rhizosphaerae TaxID=3043296 RepID=A0ABT6UV87_9GAMM|nr:lipid IV(A) 3-deoxy-D-manno-octulosonic acid transferase [Halomonas rhizosphaerae]MDI5889854.1 lipid IV(A) 3-deoxy-D-manno-octulosonic acid transferase [Halomonas rhizosphaerae]MDI5919344.1 lipid IV(A) 3-deoxy-D-manno-octulosonic acid transferase [Halomonas rhizosphaerae]